MPIASPTTEQDIRLCTAADGVRLAYSVVGAGLILVRVFGHFTYLEMEWEWLDLDPVLTTVGAEKATLLGISAGGWTAATYAVNQLERITHMVLYGAYCRGAQARPNFDPEEDQALVTLIRKGWGRDTTAFRQLFTSQFFREDADPGLIAHFNEMQRTSADPETAARSPILQADPSRSPDKVSSGRTRETPHLT